jgi:predicted dehydrogenase
VAAASGDTPVRWGILSTAHIATHKVIPSMLGSTAWEVAAIASRDAGRAAEAARTLGIPTVYGSYEALLDDPTIEAIYNPLPNPLHVPMTLAAAQRGKHVLCEKPMALSASELEQLRPYAHQVHLQEAYMVRHHPLWQQTREAVRAGEIGELRLVQVAFGYFNEDPHNLRNQADQGGGALYDIGCYAVQAGRWFFEAEATQVQGSMDVDPRFGVDRHFSGTLQYQPGQMLSFAVSTQMAPHQRLTLHGTRGALEIEIPFNIPMTEPSRYWIETAAAPGRRKVWLPTANAYRLQAAQFSHAIRHTAPSAAALDDAVATMHTIGALFASAGRVTR